MTTPDATAIHILKTIAQVRLRPTAPDLALTPDLRAALASAFGVEATPASEGDLARAALDLLARVGLTRPGQSVETMSRGEMQRVAVARALVNKPQILLADEPTGNLDLKITDEISALLKQLNKDKGLTIIMVTHNIQLAEKADRVISLADGSLQ